jgi:hypothetical protein
MAVVAVVVLVVIVVIVVLEAYPLVLVEIRK